MDKFETIYRQRIKINGKNLKNKKLINLLDRNDHEDATLYTKQLINDLYQTLDNNQRKDFFCKTACHMSKEKLQTSKEVYDRTKDISLARDELENVFRSDIKIYKKLSNETVNDLIKNGIGAAGIYKNGEIIATKIPSQFHEYHNETDPRKKKSHYCHCPRIRHLFLKDEKLDSIYCNCGGGFYQNIWETITGKKITIEVLENLFDGSDICKFKIKFSDHKEIIKNEI